MSMTDELKRLAAAIRRRNKTDRAIARIIGQPAEKGHIGEFIASRIFGIKLSESAAHKGADGRFRKGPLRNKSVNIKFYGKQDRLLDMCKDRQLNYYLVLAGPERPAGPSRRETRPLMIDAVYLFDATKLRRDLNKRGVKIGAATYVAKKHWEAAKLYPEGPCSLLTLSVKQRGLLRLFGRQ